MPVVFSVAHSGTRSRLRHLQNTCTGPEKETGPWSIRHFGEHDEEIEGFEGPVEIPVRNPVDVMISWLKRGKPLSKLFEAMERMAAYENPQATIRRTEELPIVMGHVPGGRGLHRETLRRFFVHHVSEKVLRLYEAHGY